MIVQSKRPAKRPIYQRALMRAAAVAIALAVGIEVLRLMGRAQHLDRGEGLVVALAGAGVYAIIWAAMAAMTATILKKIEDAAKGDKT